MNFQYHFSIEPDCWACVHCIQFYCSVSAILEIKRSFAVLSGSIGFIDPKSMGIDIRISLLGTSFTKLYDFMSIFVVKVNFWWTFWAFWQPSWKLKRSFAVVSYSLGFLDHTNMGIYQTKGWFNMCSLPRSTYTLLYLCAQNVNFDHFETVFSP